MVTVATYNIGIIAGEASGDLLGADLMNQLQSNSQHIKIRFYGIGGPLMKAQGLTELYPIERFSINGLIEPLKRLPELLSLRHKLVQYYLKELPIDLFIGVDFNGFNLRLASQLRQNNIKTVHYVSPTVWAWRQGRIKQIKQAVDLMLTLYPFELKIYEQHGIRAKFVGHPLADQLDHRISKQRARDELGVKPEGKLVAILPGSRLSEIKLLGNLFVQVAKCCFEQDSSIRFIIPTVNDSCHQYIQRLISKHYSDLPITLIQAQSRACILASDVVLVKSGTATLEALLCRRPMVMAYKLNKLTYSIVSKLVVIKNFALPNILAGKRIVPEYIQEQATAQTLSYALMNELNKNPALHKKLMAIFATIHDSLKCNKGQKAAQAVFEILQEKAL